MTESVIDSALKETPAKHWTTTSNFILIEKPAKPKETETGIQLPGNMKDAKIEKGVVIAYGPECANVKCGDVAYFDTQYAKKIEDNIVSVAGDMVFALVREGE